MKNPTAMQYFEWYLPADGRLWRQAEAEAARLAADGITALWLPPAYKGAAGREDVGYGVYDLSLIHISTCPGPKSWGGPVCGPLPR